MTGRGNQVQGPSRATLKAVSPGIAPAMIPDSTAASLPGCFGARSGRIVAGLWMAALLAAGTAPAQGQLPSTPAPITQTPLLPPQQYRPPAYPAAPSPSLPAAPTPGSTLPATPTSPSASAPAPVQNGPAVIANTWLPQSGAILQALDKVNAQSATLTVKVGQSARFGSLVVAVVACNIRPSDQPADAAAYLVVTDQHADSPGFKGWMLKKEPQVNMLEHPLYDLRVTGCST